MAESNKQPSKGLLSSQYFVATLLVVTFVVGFVAQGSFQKGDSGSNPASLFRTQLVGEDDTVPDTSYCPVLNVDSTTQALLAYLSTDFGNTEPTTAELGGRREFALENQNLGVTEDSMNMNGAYNALIAANDTYAAEWNFDFLYPDDISTQNLSFREPGSNAIVRFLQYEVSGDTAAIVEDASVTMVLRPRIPGTDSLANRYAYDIIPQAALISSEDAIASLQLKESTIASAELVYKNIPVELEDGTESSHTLAYRVTFTDAPKQESPVVLSDSGCATDTDSDGICDEQDNCQLTPNKDQADPDGNGIGVLCDEDEYVFDEHIGTVAYINARTGEIMGSEPDPNYKFASVQKFIPHYWHSPTADKALQLKYGYNVCQLTFGGEAAPLPAPLDQYGRPMQASGGMPITYDASEQPESFGDGIAVKVGPKLFNAEKFNQFLTYSPLSTEAEVPPKKNSGTRPGLSCVPTGFGGCESLCSPTSVTESFLSPPDTYCTNKQPMHVLFPEYVAQANAYYHLTGPGETLENMIVTGSPLAQIMGGYASSIPMNITVHPTNVALRAACGVVTGRAKFEDRIVWDKVGCSKLPENSGEKTEVHLSMYAGALDTEFLVHERFHIELRQAAPLLSKSTLPEAMILEEALAEFFGATAAVDDTRLSCRQGTCSGDRVVNDTEWARTSAFYGDNIYEVGGQYYPWFNPCLEIPPAPLPPETPTKGCALTELEFCKAKFLISQLPDVCPTDLRAHAEQDTEGTTRQFDAIQKCYRDDGNTYFEEFCSEENTSNWSLDTYCVLADYKDEETTNPDLCSCQQYAKDQCRSRTAPISDFSRDYNDCLSKKERECRIARYTEVPPPPPPDNTKYDACLKGLNLDWDTHSKATDCHDDGKNGTLTCTAGQGTPDFSDMEYVGDYATIKAGAGLVRVGMRADYTYRQFQANPDLIEEAGRVAGLLADFEKFLRTSSKVTQTEVDADPAAAVEKSNELINAYHTALVLALKPLEEDIAIYNEPTYPLIHRYYAEVYKLLKAEAARASRESTRTQLSTAAGIFADKVYNSGAGLVVGNIVWQPPSNIFNWSQFCVAEKALPIETLKIAVSGLIDPITEMEVEFVPLKQNDFDSVHSKQIPPSKEHNLKFAIAQQTPGKPELFTQEFTVSFNEPAYANITVRDSRHRTKTVTLKNINNEVATDKIPYFNPPTPEMCGNAYVSVGASYNPADFFKITDPDTQKKYRALTAAATGTMPESVSIHLTTVDHATEYSFYNHAVLDPSHDQTEVDDGDESSSTPTIIVPPAEKEELPQADPPIDPDLPPLPPLTPKDPLSYQKMIEYSQQMHAEEEERIQQKEFIDTCLNFRALPESNQISRLHNLDREYMQCATPEEITEHVCNYYNSPEARQVGLLPKDIHEQTVEVRKMAYKLSGTVYDPSTDGSMKTMHVQPYALGIRYNGGYTSLDTRKALRSSGRFPKQCYFFGIDKNGKNIDEEVEDAEEYLDEMVFALAEVFITPTASIGRARTVSKGGITIGSGFGALGSLDEVRRGMKSIRDDIINVSKRALLELQKAMTLNGGINRTVVERFQTLLREAQKRTQTAQKLLQDAVLAGESSVKLQKLQESFNAEVKALKKLTQEVNDYAEAVKIGNLDMPHAAARQLDDLHARIQGSGADPDAVAKAKQVPILQATPEKAASAAANIAKASKASEQLYANLEAFRNKAKSLFADMPAVNGFGADATFSKPFKTTDPALEKVAYSLYGKNYVTIVYSYRDREYARNVGKLIMNTVPDKLSSGTYTYALLQDGRMIFGKVDDAIEFGVKHAHLASGNPVVAAGEILVESTGTFKFNLNSGSYMYSGGSDTKLLLDLQPEGKYIQKLSELFTAGGVKAEFTAQKIFDFDGTITHARLSELCNIAEFIASNSDLCRIIAQ